MTNQLHPPGTRRLAAPRRMPYYAVPGPPLIAFS